MFPGGWSAYTCVIHMVAAGPIDRLDLAVIGFKWVRDSPFGGEFSDGWGTS